MNVIGRTDSAGADCRSTAGERPTDVDGRPAGAFGRYRALDGSEGGRVALDFDRPHVALVVGKRGSGKSHTMSVVAEGLARADGVAPIVADPMDAFGTLAAPTDEPTVPARVVDPAVSAGALDPTVWCELLGLDPEDGAGALVWRAAATADSLAGMRAAVADADVPETTRRAAANHLELAESWGVFENCDGEPAGTGQSVGDRSSAGESECGLRSGDASLFDGAATVLDLAGAERAPANAAVAAVANRAYRERVNGTVRRLPWLLLDEAHVFFEGVAASELRCLVTRGRQPGVSLVAATQRPSALPAVAVSQADLLVVHRLSSRADREALAAARPDYAAELADSPTAVGEALVIDDARETVHRIRVRERDTPDGGASPRAVDCATS